MIYYFKDFLVPNAQCFICGDYILQQYKEEFSCKQQCSSLCIDSDSSDRVGCMHIKDINGYNFSFDYRPNTIEVLHNRNQNFCKWFNIEDFDIKTYNDLKIAADKILKIIDLE
ncbi:MAG: hypothetical protein LC122_14345 [Chitinophagales bacterium]|nr:hypothetical protein [Chitinophagales bacterium]